MLSEKLLQELQRYADYLDDAEARRRRAEYMAAWVREQTKGGKSLASHYPFLHAG